MVAIASLVVLLASINSQPSRAASQVATSSLATDGRCHVIQDLPREVRSTAEYACGEALERIETNLGIEISSPLEFALSDARHPVADTDVPIIRVAAVDSLERLTRLGMVQHEFGHLAVLTWLMERNASSGGGGYLTRLPDVLDEGLAILAEPPSTRAGRRRSLNSFDVPSFRRVLDLDHPGVGALHPIDAITRTTRRVLAPCPDCPSPPFHPTRWVVITERVVGGGVEGPVEADTTLWADRPSPPDVSSTERFYSLSDAAISFLSEQFEDPAQLSVFILDLIEQQPEAPPMPTLVRRLGLSEAEIEARWTKWISEAVEVGIEAGGT